MFSLESFFFFSLTPTLNNRKKSPPKASFLNSKLDFWKIKAICALKSQYFGAQEVKKKKADTYILG